MLAAGRLVDIANVAVEVETFGKFLLTLGTYKLRRRTIATIRVRLAAVGGEIVRPLVDTIASIVGARILDEPEVLL